MFLQDVNPEEQSVDLDALKRIYHTLDGLKNDDINKKFKDSITLLTTGLIKEKTKKISKPHQLRQLEILLEHPYMMDPHFHNILLDITRVVLELPNELKATLKNWFQGYSVERFKRLVSLYQQFITMQLNIMGAIDEKISYATRVLGLLNNTNDSRPRGEQVNFSEFYNDAVNTMVDLESDYRRWMRSKSEKLLGFSSFSFCNYPYILDANSKSKVLEIDAQFQQSIRMRESLTQSLMKTGNVTMSQLFFILKVDREHLLETTLNGLVGQDPRDYKKQLRVMFTGEEGVDEGGVKKEFFQLLIKQVFDVNFGMFTYNEGQRFFWFNADSLEGNNTFRLMGILLGLAIYNSVILDVHFPTLVYKKLLERGLNLEDDLMDFDPDLARGLKQLLEYEGNVAEVYDRVFQVETESFGVVKKVDLKPNGANIILTNENRKEYVDLYVNWVLNESIASQFKAFKNGFDIVCKGPPLELFKFEELELMIIGSSKLDFDALERATVYVEGYKKDDAYIKEFWKVVKSLDEEEKKKFLFFVTGSDRAPIRGLGSMEFIIMKNGEPNSIPTSHTCFSHLLLPKYESVEQLREKLLLAINNSRGFGLM
jgi:ubiquitin-protein ligase E3 A